MRLLGEERRKGGERGRAGRESRGSRERREGGRVGGRERREGEGSDAGDQIGGLIGQIVYNRNSTYVGVLMASTTSLGIFPLMYLLNLPEDPPSVPVLCVIAFFGGVIACVTGKHEGAGGGGGGAAAERLSRGEHTSRPSQRERAGDERVSVCRLHAHG